MVRLKSRINFLVAKIYCLSFEYIEIIIAVITVFIGIMLQEIPFAIFLLIVEFVYFKNMIVARKGCFQIVRAGLKEYKLSMCKNIPKEDKKFTYFKSCFQDVFNEETIRKLTGKSIYVNTHGIFTRGILQILCDTVYTKEMLKTDVEEGYVIINERKIMIRKLKDRKNRMLATRYPFWPSIEELIEFEKENKLMDFYEFRIPIEVFKAIDK